MATSNSAHSTRSPFARSGAVWVGVGVAAWAVSLALTTESPLTDAPTVWWTVLAVVVLVSMTVSVVEPFRTLSDLSAAAAVAVTLGGWAALMFHDDRWSVLTFALYALCFAKGRTLGVVLAAVVSGIWLVSWIDADQPSWTLLFPFAAFAVGAIMSVTIHRVGDENAAQAALIAQLEATREDLAASERERGTLEERARFAGEIHDTLAQGFTSIVLLSRATRRSRDWQTGLETIESTAEENLQSARRLVAAMGPAELENGSLVEAMQRQLATLDDEVDATFTVSGTPVAIDSDVEVALLRAAQEAVLNVHKHARARAVHITLSYFGDSVALDVQDDGVGFSGAAPVDRGSLTGGQGLEALEQRARTLGGNLDIEPGVAGGTTISVQLPVTRR
ncbi:MAG: sensor histidine kinase [Acidimicrobiales bacterium]